MSYLALARRYRPQSLTVTGRVYDPTLGHPYRVTLRPFYGSTKVTVEAHDRELRQFVSTRNLDDPILLSVAEQLFVKIKIEASQACCSAS